MTHLSDADLLRLEAQLEMTGSADGFKPTLRKRHNNEESRSQQALIAWWNVACKNYGLPPWSMFAIPNGGRRDALTGVFMKKEGVRSGIPDLMLCVPKNGKAGAFIEMKTAVGKLSPEQRDIIPILRDLGYAVEVCRSTREAVDVIEKYLK